MRKNKFISAGVSFSFLIACTSPQKHAEVFSDSVEVDRAPAAVPQTMPASQVFNHHSNLSAVNWRNLFTELSYMNIRKQAKSETEFQALLKSSMYYAKSGANKTYWDIVNGTKTSDDAFKARETMLGWDGSINANVDSSAKAAPQMETVSKMGAGGLIEVLRASAKDPNQKFVQGRNYFKTQAGQAVLEALKDYVLVIIPGFGSHTIQDYSWPEAVRQINEYYGRQDASNDKNPYQRIGRTTKSTARENLGADWIQFHRTNQNPNIKFDIVHPLGFELGFSMGKDAESANELANRLAELKQIPSYQNKKFILLGYSKGAPIATKMVVQRPDVSKDVVAVVTMAGVVQGALPANSFVDDLTKASGKSNFNDVKEYFRKQYETAAAKYGTLADGYTNQLISAQTKSQLSQKFTEFFGKSFNLEGGGVQSAFKDPAERDRMLDGINDMSNFQSIRWNLQNMNDDSFKKPITFFNFSMLTNVKDFVMPMPGNLDVTLTAPTVVPQFYYNTGFGMDYSKFSRDNVFLYLTSISGFEQAAGGLFDTQMEWLDTKSMFLDSRPLAYSLSRNQIELFDKVVLSEKDPAQRLTIENPSYFSTPRYQLVRLLNEKRRKTANNINVVDLGEFRGTHWDVAFEQVYKPDTDKKIYTHQFPRRAVQASVIELLAIFKTTGGF